MSTWTDKDWFDYAHFEYEQSLNFIKKHSPFVNIKWCDVKWIFSLDFKSLITEHNRISAKVTPKFFRGSRFIPELMQDAYECSFMLHLNNLAAYMISLSSYPGYKSKWKKSVLYELENIIRGSEKRRDAIREGFVEWSNTYNEWMLTSDLNK